MLFKLSKNKAFHLKEHSNVSMFAKFECHWVKRKDIVHFFKIGKLRELCMVGGKVFPPIHSKLSCLSDF